MTRKNWLMLIVFVAMLTTIVVVGIAVDAYADIVFGSGFTFSWSGKLLLYTHPALVLTFVLAVGYVAGYFVAHVWGFEQPTPTPDELKGKPQTPNRFMNDP